MDNIEDRVIIVGAGPIGLYMANAMQSARIDFVILEQRDTVLDPSGQLLFVWPQSVRLFDQIGLLEKLQEAAFEVHQKKRTYGVDGRVMTISKFWGFMREKFVVLKLHLKTPQLTINIVTGTPFYRSYAVISFAFFTPISTIKMHVSKRARRS